VGIKTHMGYNQEAYNAGCTALARALESVSRRHTAPERVTIFTDAQAASGVWPPRSLAPARSMRSRQGSTSQCYGRLGLASPSRSGGAQRTRES